MKHAKRIRIAVGAVIEVVNELESGIAPGQEGWLRDKEKSREASEFAQTGWWLD
jgi:hypothetical protein